MFYKYLASKTNIPIKSNAKATTNQINEIGCYRRLLSLNFEALSFQKY